METQRPHPPPEPATLDVDALPAFPGEVWRCTVNGGGPKERCEELEAEWEGKLAAVYAESAEREAGR